MRASPTGIFAGIASVNASGHMVSHLGTGVGSIGAAVLPFERLPTHRRQKLRCGAHCSQTNTAASCARLSPRPTSEAHQS